MKSDELVLPEGADDPTADASAFPAGRQNYTKKGRLLSAYPRDRTKEHFMTVSFSRRRTGEVTLAAQAWQVRARGGPKNLPLRDFPRAYRTTLT